jgi:hypothetical protein
VGRDSTRAFVAAILIAAVPAAAAGGASPRGFTLFAGPPDFWIPREPVIRLGDVSAAAGDSAPRSPAVAALGPARPKKRFWLAAGEWSLAQFLPWAFDHYVSKDSFSDISWQTAADNIRAGFGWDRDSFKTNQSNHPYHGSTFFNAGRSNGYGFWESSLFALAGSLFWEYFMENQHPATNDLINTTLGGMSRGEISHRLGALILDGPADGWKPYLHEAGAAVVDPVNAVTRLVTGNLGEPPQDPDLPGSPELSFTAILGYRHVSFPRASDPTQTTFDLELRYGDPFSGENRRPFDWFDLDYELAVPASSLTTRVIERGELVGWGLGADGHVDHRLSIIQSFDYFNGQELVFGAQSISPSHLARVRLGDLGELRTEAGVYLAPLAALQTDYLSLNERKTGLNYDYGPAAGLRGNVRLERRGRELLRLDYLVFWHHTSHGISLGSTAQLFNADGRWPILGRLSIGAGVTWLRRETRYVGLPDVAFSGTQARLYAAWTIR